MKTFLKKLENIFAAVAFAEAGEFDTAKEMIKEEKQIKKRKRLIPRPRMQLRAHG